MSEIYIQKNIHQVKSREVTTSCAGQLITRREYECPTGKEVN